MQEEVSDEMLMAAIGNGDQRAFKTLMDRHMKSAIQLSERILMAQAEAEGVAQEAFVRVWRHASSFDPARARFTTWIYRIIVNLAIDRKRRPRTYPIELVAERASGEPHALDCVIARQEAQSMQAALAGLQDRQRAAIALYHMQGLSCREAAEVLHMKDKAFESLLIRARKALKLAYLAGGMDEHEMVMSLEEFQRLAENWGSDIARWPSSGHTEARRIARTEEGRQALADARAFDNAISSAFPGISDRRAQDVTFRVLSRVARESEPQRMPWQAAFASWFIPAGGVALSAALGVAIALMTPQLGAHQNSVILLSAILDSGALAADLVVR